MQYDVHPPWADLKPGDSKRVGAILDSDPEEKIVKFLGFGIYVGDKVPLEAVGFWAEMAREMNCKNPCLELDNGTMLYGCECWWGTEDKIKQELEKYKAAGYTIVDTNIMEVRQAYNKKQGRPKKRRTKRGE